MLAQTWFHLWCRCQFEWLSIRCSSLLWHVRNEDIVLCTLSLFYSLPLFLCSSSLLSPITHLHPLLSQLICHLFIPLIFFLTLPLLFFYSFISHLFHPHFLPFHPSFLISSFSKSLITRGVYAWLHLLRFPDLSFLCSPPPPTFLTLSLALYQIPLPIFALYL